MAASSRARSNTPVLGVTNRFQRPISPSGRFCSTPGASSSARGFANSSSSFSDRSTTFFPRSASPTRVNLTGSPPQTHSIRFSLDRPSSPGRSISVVSRRDPVVRTSISASGHRKTCMCSPTTHPGSFRCSLHKGLRQNPAAAVSSPSNRLNARRSAMTNSLVRIGTVEGDLVKRALAALIRPSSHRQRRRADFQPRPSRLSKMSIADDQSCRTDC
ncbi:uncharacterized protein LOC110111694 [Dendrobium catenatum]|uniref:Serine-rich protein-like protein n=1 Tax=Dendrobium catenatum TaxID=906689 RepID=A0A2I0VT13_9ASPA|nr:uncharacterized protein LOC110111694 [Dendrobium catenatum]PKU66550.1 hypothetical protein MA16_Dca006878 [Dendrobium catenatum]